jgi:hypothetical protein
VDRKTVVAWAMFRLNEGRQVAYNGPPLNPNGAQCVNVIGEYRHALGLEWWGGNAGDWARQAPPGSSMLTGAHLAKSRAGDVLVIPECADYPMGHVQLVLDGSHGTKVHVLEQNSPTGTPWGDKWTVATAPMVLLRFDSPGAY